VLASIKSGALNTDDLRRRNPSRLHQSLVEELKIIRLEEDSLPVRSTAKQKLKQVDFRFAGKNLRALVDCNSSL
jgi:hypothetical protein